MDGITRKVLNRSGNTESFSGTLLKIAEDFERIGWIDEDAMGDAFALDGYKQLYWLLEILNEALAEASMEYRFAIDGSDLIVRKLDS